MHRLDVAVILNGPHSETIRKWVDGGVVQMWSEIHKTWLTLDNQSNIVFLSDSKYRIKPDPVFKEIAIFKLKAVGSSTYALEKDYKFTFPEQWKRISDWVKVEIKDDTSNS